MPLSILIVFWFVLDKVVTCSLKTSDIFWCVKSCHKINLLFYYRCVHNWPFRIGINKKPFIFKVSSLIGFCTTGPHRHFKPHSDLRMHQLAIGKLEESSNSQRWPYNPESCSRYDSVSIQPRRDLCSWVIVSRISLHSIEV